MAYPHSIKTFAHGRHLSAAARQRVPLNVLARQCMLEVHAIGKELEGEGFSIDADNRMQYWTLANYFVGSPLFQDHKPGNSLNRGLLIQGSPGTGKSLALTLFVEWIRRNGHGRVLGGQPRIIGTHTVCDQIETDGFAKHRKYADWNWFCFDDLGDEPLWVQQPYKSQRFEPLRRILSDRYINFKRNGQLTIATTNYTLEILGSMYGERLRSRMYEMFNCVAFVGEDRRELPRGGSQSGPKRKTA